MNELKKFINIAINSFNMMCIDEKSRYFDLFRKNKENPSWTIYATIHDEHGITDIGGDFEITSNVKFQDVLNVLVDSNVNIKTHAYYFDDIY